MKRLRSIIVVPLHSLPASSILPSSLPRFRYSPFFPAFLTSLSSDAAFSDRAWTRLFRSGLDVTERKGTAMKHLCILIVSPFSLFFCLFHQFTAFLRSCFRRLTVSEAQWTAFGHSLLEPYDSIFLSKSILFFFVSCFLYYLLAFLFSFIFILLHISVFTAISDARFSTYGCSTAGLIGKKIRWKSLRIFIA